MRRTRIHRRAISLDRARHWIAMIALIIAASTTLDASGVLLLHWNDLHGQVLPHGEQGGVRALADRVATERRAQGVDATLVLDAGDWYQGTPEGNVPQGRFIVDLYNTMGIDAAAIGNHEFDFGLPNLSELLDRAQFTVLSANLESAELDGQLYHAHTMVERGGIRFGIIGLLAPETPTIVRRDVSAAIRVRPLAPCVREQIAILRRQGAEYIIVLSHVGVDGDQELADTVDGIDLIVGGHSHTRLDEARHGRFGTTIVQAGSRGAYLGRVMISRRSGGFETQAQLIPLTKREQSQSAALETVMAKYLPAVAGRMAEQLGVAALPLDKPDRNRKKPTVSALGYWLGQVMAEVTRADCAFHNVGGIRDRIAAGPITRRELFQISPFGNQVVAVELPGAVLIEILRQSLEGPPRSRLEPYGIEVSWHRVDGAPRFLEARIGGEPIDSARQYRVATNSFIAEDAGDGWTHFRQHGRITRYDVGIYEASVAAVRRLSAAGRELTPAAVPVFRRSIVASPQPIATSARELAGPRRRNVGQPPHSSPLGSWLCRLMRDATAADIALLSLPADTTLPRGEICARTLFAAVGAPDRDEDRIVSGEMSGRAIVQLLDAWLASDPPISLDVDGANVTWLRIHDEVRVGSVTIHGAAIVPDRGYRCAWTAATAQRLRAHGIAIADDADSADSDAPRLYERATVALRDLETRGRALFVAADDRFPPERRPWRHVAVWIALFSCVGIARYFLGTDVDDAR